MSRQNRYCIHCGKKLGKTAIYCPFCGNKIEDISDDISEDMEEDMFEDDFEDPYDQKGSSGLLKWLIGIVVVLVVLVIAAIALFVGLSKRDNGAASVEEPVSESTVTEVEETVQDGNEPNDSEDQAVVLTDGSPVTGYLESKDDIDYFVINAAEAGSAVLEFRHTADGEKDGVGWRLNYGENGRTSTKLCWLSEDRTEIELSLASGINYVYISADSAMSADTLERVRNTPYYISVTMAGEEEEEEEEEEEQEPTVNSGYIIPDSNSRYLSVSDLKGLSSSELRLARNEIYARHGRTFDDSGVQNYFNSQSWYKGTISPDAFSESMLNAYEKANVELIRQYE